MTAPHDKQEPVEGVDIASGQGDSRLALRHSVDKAADDAVGRGVEQPDVAVKLLVRGMRCVDTNVFSASRYRGLERVRFCVEDDLALVKSVDVNALWCVVVRLRRFYAGASTKNEVGLVQRSSLQKSAS